MPALAETKKAVSHVRRLNSLRFILGAAQAVFNEEATASEEGSAALSLESAVFKKARIFPNGAERASDEEVPIFSEAVLALTDADSSLIEDPIFSCKQAIGAGLAAVSDLSVWAASI